MIEDPYQEVQTEEICPRCKLAHLWVIEGECDNIFVIDIFGCTNCNYRENREREIQMTDDEVTDEEYYKAIHKLGT